MTTETHDVLLKVKNLKKEFITGSSLFKKYRKRVRAVDGVSFELKKGRTLGLVGESGCGKSTLGRSLIRLLDPTEGSIEFLGTDIANLDENALRPFRRSMQMIFQDPYASLNPRMTVLETLLEPLSIHNIGEKSERMNMVYDLLDVVGLRKNCLTRYPHEFSGGQRQRIGIARALALKPSLIIADEPVSALDVSVQSQVLNLIRDLQDRFSISFVFIAHDLAVVQHISDDVGVMYLGELVELTSAERLYSSSRHPYTQALLAAIPVPDPTHVRTAEPLQGDVPSPLNPPSGCRFHTRCPFAINECQTKAPDWRNISKDAEQPHWVRCHRVEQSLEKNQFTNEGAPQ